ncbi:MAG: amidohydrolase family protein [Planctomycetota bacterium]|jgi:imidazolonepropionase-like amidohydrolase
MIPAEKTRMRPLPILCLLALVGAALIQFGSLPASDPIPGRKQVKPIAIVGATIHPVDRTPIEAGTVLFQGGRIVAIGEGVEIPAGAEVIDASGKHVYPGLIAPSTELGLIEIGSVRATRDQTEVGTMNPNVRAEISINPDSEHLPVARANGIALAVTRPSGGRISGTSALIRLDGWTWEDLTVVAPLGLEVQWPYLATGGRGRRGWGGNAARAQSERDTIFARIDETFTAATVYANARPEPADGTLDGAAPDLRMEAMRPAVTGEIPVFLHAEDARQIRSSVEWALGRGLKPIIVGGRDAPTVAGFLAERQVPVIYGPIHRLPSSRDEAPSAPFDGPATLHEAGVPFAIGAFDTSNVRNLPYHAATAAAHGLPPEIALRSLTLSAAEIFGVADRYGSITPGKSATVIITDGDPLEITSQVEAMWIDGVRVDLRSRHTQLFEKYTEKLNRAR